MAGVIVETRLRPCMVKDEKKALFHGWSYFSSVIAPSPMVGGHPGGTIASTRALVEYEDGRMDQVLAEDIRFLDNYFEEYTFDEKKEPEIQATWLTEYDPVFGGTHIRCSHCGFSYAYRGHINPELYEFKKTCSECHSKMVEHS